MAKHVSWIPRLAEIRAGVEKSDASHFDRSDIERLFELQPRAALRLLEGLPRGRSHGRAVVVEREALLRFLAEIERTGKVPAANAKASRRKIRNLVRPAHEVAKGSVDTIPMTVSLKLGRLDVVFKDAEDLIEQLWSLVMAVRDDEDRFLRTFFPELKGKDPQPAEREAIETTLRDLEAAYEKHKRPVKAS